MAGKEEYFSLKPCGGARRVAEEKEEDALVCNVGSVASALKPCSHGGGSKTKNMGGLSLKPCTTTSTAAAAAFAGKEFQFKQCTNQSMKDSTGEQECSLKICSTKRKVPADGHDEEDIALAVPVTTVQAIEVAGADSEVDSSDDDDEPVSEAEFAAFYEEEKAKHDKFVVERVLPRLENAKAIQRLLQEQFESVLKSK